MKISFDLDDTLIPGIKTFPTEPQNILQKVLGTEPLRAGTKQLFKALKDRGHTVGIYTTSYRSYWRIRLMCILNGFTVDFLINQKSNQKELSRRGIRSSKHPLTFGIDVHIDDSEGVAMEGQRHGFRTIIVDQNDEAWHLTVLRCLSDPEK